MKTKTTYKESVQDNGIAVYQQNGYIPVYTSTSVAFYYLTEPKRSALVNIGTGSQVSLLSEETVSAELIEARYDVLNTFARKGRESGNILNIRTTFAGTRANADLRGEITEIGEENFTPEALAAGVLYGMANELYAMYQVMLHENVDTLIASGNGVRKNAVLQAVLEDVFGMKVQIPAHTEEAAFGAAMFGAQAK